MQAYYTKRTAPHREVLPDAMPYVVPENGNVSGEGSLSVDNLAVLVSVFRDE